MKRIKWFALVTAMICMILVAGTAPAEDAGIPIGFGFVNADAVALRKAPGGERITRLPQDTLVWVKDSETDSQGELWYRIDTALHVNYAYPEYSGWMMARFIDAKEALWQDVAAVAAGDNGMVVLKKDGSVIVATEQKFLDGRPWQNMRNWAVPYQPAMQVGFLYNGGLCLLDSEGHFHSTEPSGRLYAFDTMNLCLLDGRADAVFGITPEGQLVHRYQETRQVERADWMDDGTLKDAVMMAANDEYVLVLTKEGNVLAYEYFQNPLGTPAPHWNEWKGLADMDTEWILSGNMNKHRPLIAYTGVRTDGTVMAHPAEAASAVSGWTDMKEVEIGNLWMVGLKQDGTVISAGLADYPALDVSGWTEIESIEAGHDFCVGLKKDGTLVFAGNFFHEVD